MSFLVYDFNLLHIHRENSRKSKVSEFFLICNSIPNRNFTPFCKIFGPYQISEKVIPKLIHQFCLRRKCCIHGEGDGTRKFLHISDIVQAFDIIMQKGQLCEISKIGTTVDISIHDIWKWLIRIMKRPDVNPHYLIEHVEHKDG
jgi:dTDP-D-glucose 4,6-dehydratase